MLLWMWLALAPVYAQDAPAGDKAPPLASSEAQRSVSVILSPVHLALPMVELTVDVKAAERVGIAAVLGGGTSSGFGVYEVGVQPRFYATGNFDSGMLVGLEAIYYGVAGSVEGVSASGAGLSAGPMFGGKHTFPFGLTLDGQVGASFLLASASSGDASVSESGISPLLNLGLGWSF